MQQHVISEYDNAVPQLMLITEAHGVSWLMIMKDIHAAL